MPPITERSHRPGYRLQTAAAAATEKQLESASLFVCAYMECTHVISKNCAPHFHHTQNHHQHTIQHSYAVRFTWNVHTRARAAARLVVDIWCCPKIRTFVGSNHHQNMARPKLSDIESAKVMAWAAFFKKHGCWKPCAGMTTRAHQKQQALAREKFESGGKA
jgi:hypothetical protein